MKLYIVTCQGMTPGHGSAYVVAEDPTSAYVRLRAHLDSEGLGFDGERELDDIKLVADEDSLSELPTLFLPKEPTP